MSAPDSYSYQWQRADDAGFTTSVTDIGSDAATHELVAADEGKYIRCVVTATNGGGSTDANSNVVGPVAAVPVAVTPGAFIPLVDGGLRYTAILLRPGNSPLVLTRQAKVCRYSTVMPGGFGSCVLELPGDFRRWAREIPYRATLQVLDGTQVIFEGRVEDRGMAWNENGVATKVSIFGLQRRLSDDSLVRVWSQREINWLKSMVSSSLVTVGIGGVDSTDLTRVGVRFANETGAVFPSIAGMPIPLCGQIDWLVATELARIMGEITVASAGPAYGRITWGSSGAHNYNGDLTRSAFDLDISSPANSGSIHLRGDFAGDPDGAEVIFEDIRLLGTSLTEDIAGGIYGGNILADLVAQVTGIYPGQIDEGSDFALPSCAAATRRYVRDIVDEICAYYTREWAVWEGGIFNWKQPALDEVQWICHTADFLPGTEITGSSDDCYERIFVLYTNAGSADNGFPDEQSATATEQRNPFVDSGEHRDAMVSPGFPMTDTSALQLATKLLGDYGKYPGARGQIILPASKLVQHATLGARPARLIRAGDNITVPDLPKTDILVEGRDGETQFHIVASDVDLIANRVTLQIEGQSKRADALLARLSAATSLLGG